QSTLLPRLYEPTAGVPARSYLKPPGRTTARRDFWLTILQSCFAVTLMAALPPMPPNGGCHDSRGRLQADHGINAEDLHGGQALYQARDPDGPAGHAPCCLGSAPHLLERSGARRAPVSSRRLRAAL